MFGSLLLMSLVYCCCLMFLCVFLTGLGVVSCSLDFVVWSLELEFQVCCWSLVGCGLFLCWFWFTFLLYRLKADREIHTCIKIIYIECGLLTCSCFILFFFLLRLLFFFSLSWFSFFFAFCIYIFFWYFFSCGGGGAGESRDFAWDRKRQIEWVYFYFLFFFRLVSEWFRDWVIERLWVSFYIVLV